ncbi:MAG: mechanosensitive ion channel [Trueperaceae bacterium]|nr:mechanosensitive ion channel [Trueperaceae bacterium]
MPDTILGLPTEQLIRYGLNVLMAIIILIVGWNLARYVSAFVRRTVVRSERFDRTLGLIFSQLTRWVILVFTAIAVLNRFGFQTASFIALLGAAGLAIGLALQGALSNVASGVLLLSQRPFRVGDAVEISGISGIVDEIGLFTTKMHTFDNIGVHVPNSNVWNSAIKNMSEFATRRLELTFGISYQDDIGKAMGIIQQELESDERALKDPAYRIGVTELADSSVNLLVWVWVNRPDYLDLKLDLIKQIKERFDQNGISIPFPQSEIRVVGSAQLPQTGSN